jgi:hypothetical protein
MIKYIFGFTMFLLFLSCSIDYESSNNSSSNYQKWRYKINGVQYEWEGDSNDFRGGSVFSQDNSETSIELFSVQEPIISFNFNIPILNTQTYILENFDAYLTDYSGPIVSYYTDDIYKITLNITQVNNDITPNRIKGTFSGRLFRETNSGNIVVLNITDGYFEAIRE